MWLNKDYVERAAYVKRQPAWSESPEKSFIPFARTFLMAGNQISLHSSFPDTHH